MNINESYKMSKEKHQNSPRPYRARTRYILRICRWAWLNHFREWKKIRIFFFSFFISNYFGYFIFSFLIVFSFFFFYVLSAPQKSEQNKLNVFAILCNFIITMLKFGRFIFLVFFSMLFVIRIFCSFFVDFLYSNLTLNA